MSRLVFAIVLAAGCAGATDPSPMVVPRGFPRPLVPNDNPLTAAKVELGRHLFYDTRLSGNETQSCASCHQQELAFTDGLAHAVGSTGEAHPRGAMSLANAAYSATYGWANPLLQTLEKQAPVPMYGEVPVELGLAGRDDEVIARLRGDTRMQRLFEAAFPDGAITMERVIKSIASFERTIVSGNSPYDRNQMSPSAGRGRDLFFSEQLECFHCHGGFNFSGATTHDGTVFAEIIFHNTGLYDPYEAPNTGVHEITGEARDMGRFKAPTLRNIAVTAPYMHDGSIATLDEVLTHYASGGRAASARTSGFIHAFELSFDQRADLIAFLNALTDEDFLRDPRYQRP